MGAKLSVTIIFDFEKKSSNMKKFHRFLTLTKTKISMDTAKSSVEKGGGYYFHKAPGSWITVTLFERKILRNI